MSQLFQMTFLAKCIVCERILLVGSVNDDGESTIGITPEPT
jgi:hypothetical protein